MEYILFLPQSFGRIICVLCYLLTLFYVIPVVRQNKTFANIAYYVVAGLVFHLAYLFTFSVNHPVAVYGIMVAGLIPIGLTFILRFAYDFPVLRWPREKKIVSIIITFAIAISIVDYIHNADQADLKINATGYVTKYTSQLIPGLAFLISLFSFLVFIRQAIATRRDSEITNDFKGPLSFAVLFLVELATAMVLFVFFYTNHKTDFAIHAILNVLFFLVIGGYVMVLLKYSKQYVSLYFKLLGLTLAVSCLSFNMLGYVMISNKIEDFDTRVESSFQNYMQHKKPLYGLTPLYIFDRQDRAFVENPINNPGFEVELRQYLGYGIKEHKESYLFSGSERNYIQYQFFYEKRWLLVGFSEIPYRKMTHGVTMQLLYLLVIYLLILGIVLPFLVKQGILQPVKTLIQLIESSMKKPHQANPIKDRAELALLADSVQTLQRSMQDYEKIEEQYKRLKEAVVENRTTYKQYTSEGLSEKANQVRAFIDKNYNYDLSREGLAASVDINPSTLGKAFKKLTQKSIRDYQNERRVAESCELLQGEMSIIEIAYRVGYDSLRTFNRNFKSIMGCTPSDYRERQLLKPRQ